MNISSKKSCINLSQKPKQEFTFSKEEYSKINKKRLEIEENQNDGKIKTKENSLKKKKNEEEDIKCISRGKNKTDILSQPFQNILEDSKKKSNVKDKSSKGVSKENILTKSTPVDEMKSKLGYVLSKNLFKANIPNKGSTLTKSLPLKCQNDSSKKQILNLGAVSKINYIKTFNYIYLRLLF